MTVCLATGLHDPGKTNYIVQQSILDDACLLVLSEQLIAQTQHSELHTQLLESSEGVVVCGGVLWVGGVQGRVREAHCWKEVHAANAVFVSVLAYGAGLNYSEKIFHEVVDFSLEGEGDDFCRVADELRKECCHDRSEFTRGGRTKGISS